MPIQLHIQKMKREADVIKKNEKSANDYLTQTSGNEFLTFKPIYCIILHVRGDCLTDENDLGNLCNGMGENGTIRLG